ncbi:unnamed protein product [Calypogeia fissa]
MGVMGGIVEIVGANAVWMDPVAVLSSSYSAYEVSHSQYYSRSCFDKQNGSEDVFASESVKSSRKRKRKKAAYEPNKKEQLAALRHQEARCAILNAHSTFLETTYAEISSREIIDSNTKAPCSEISKVGPLSSTIGSTGCDLDFRQLAEVWQAPLYELNVLETISERTTKGGTDWGEEQVSRTYQLFNTLIENVDEEAIGECGGAYFLLPRDSQFVISDVSQVHQIIPHNNQDTGSPNPGYNIIVIDPPWENKSVQRNSLYPMMPNRQLFSLPIRRLAHSEGALVALWITNREKLQQFVEKELFPAWGVKLAATWYWLKLNASGQMISPLDLQHHKPYECLLLGYLFGQSQEAASIESAQEDDTRKVSESHMLYPPEKFVVMSIPGDHSRKPPLGSLLARYAPGPRPIRGVELFARELHTGWTSWGNEPLYFQNLKYFQHRA